MRFMPIVRATREAEAGALPEPGPAAAMMALDQERMDAEVVKAGEGLPLSSRGARVAFRDGGTTVRPGPVPAEEFVAGFRPIGCAPPDAAIGRARLSPAPTGAGKEAAIEVRGILDPGELGDAIPPEVPEHERRPRAAADGSR